MARRAPLEPKTYIVDYVLGSRNMVVQVEAQSVQVDCSQTELDMLVFLDGNKRVVFMIPAINLRQLHEKGSLKEVFRELAPVKLRG